MTDAEYIKIIEQLNREMIKAMDSMLEACEALKAVSKTDNRNYIHEWITERLR